MEDLKTCPPQLTKCLDHLKLLDRKIDSLQDLPSDELREVSKLFFISIKYANICVCVIEIAFAYFYFLIKIIVF